MTLLERDKNAPNAWEGSLPVPSRYTYGLAGERFFRALKDDGAILGSTEGTRFQLRPIDGGTRTWFSGVGVP